MIKSLSFAPKLLCILLFVALLQFQTTYCQSVSKLTWTTDSEFLPQNSIKSIVPDKYGFIWMTTENGLVRYDGKNFDIYDSHTTQIKSNRLIYITGNYQADSLYTTNDWDEQCIFIHQRKVHIVDKKLHPKALQFDKNDPNSRFISNGVPSLLLDAPKRPYHIPLASGNYYFIDNNTVRLFNAKKQLLHKIHFEYESNSCFFAIGDILFYLEKNGKYAIIENGRIKKKILNIDPKAENMLYWNSVAQQAFFYSGNNLYQLHYKNNQLQKSLLIENEDLANQRINSIYFNVESKIVYLGSTTKGLGIYKIKNFKTLVPNKPGLSEIFYSLSTLNSSTVISGSGILMNNNEIIADLNFISDKYGMALDRDKNIWTYEGSKLIRYQKKGDYQQSKVWELGKEITSLFADSNGEIWYSLALGRKKSGILFNFIPDENPTFTTYTTLDFHPKFLAKCDPNTLLMAGNDGLKALNLRNKEVTIVKGTESLKVRNIFISSKKNIWISTYENGFFLLKNNKIYSFPLDKNQYLLSSHCIVEDKKGFFWISTNKGLFQVKERNLLDYANATISKIYYHYYSKEAGFLTNEFNGGCQPCATTNATNIFFPSINGVVTFNPDKIEPVLPTQPTFIDEVMVDNQRTTINDTLFLNREFERITFFITSPYYGNVNNLNFEAKLEGTGNKEWTKISKENNISFTTLSPGEYQLIVRKLSDFDSKYDYKKITIIIEPAFWETLWFKIVVVLLIIVIGIISYNIRVRYITRKNLLLEKKINEQTNDLKSTISTLRATRENLNKQIENNTKIIQYITHDIKSPLKFMAMASKYMYDSFDKDSEDLKENIQAIFTSSSQMFNFVDNLLEYSKGYLDKGVIDNEEFKINDVVFNKIALFQNIANAKKVVIKNHIPTEAILTKNKQLFSIIIHNLLDNAIKNTIYGTIQFSAGSDDLYSYVSIQDTGNGIEKHTVEYYQTLIDNYDLQRDKKFKTMGMYMIIELLLILNGKMNIESELGKGTKITLMFDHESA